MSSTNHLFPTEADVKAFCAALQEQMLVALRTRQPMCLNQTNFLSEPEDFGGYYRFVEREGSGVRFTVEVGKPALISRREDELFRLRTKD